MVAQSCGLGYLYLNVQRDVIIDIQDALCHTLSMVKDLFNS